MYIYIYIHVFVFLDGYFPVEGLDGLDAIHLSKNLRCLGLRILRFPTPGAVRRGQIRLSAFSVAPWVKSLFGSSLGMNHPMVVF